MISKLLLRRLFFSIFTVVCLLQCANILQNYFAYPYSTDITELSTLESPELPGLTICNNNRLDGCLASSAATFSSSPSTHLVYTREKENNSQSLTSVGPRSFVKRYLKTVAKQRQGVYMEWPKITLLGDSITRRSFDPDFGCWAGLLAHRVGGYFDVDNRGTDGYNTRLALKYCPQLFPRSYLEKVEIFVLFYGHNDAWRPPYGVPVKEYEENTRAIIKYLEENGLEKKKVILITPTWYHMEDWAEHARQFGYANVVKSIEECEKYSESILRIGKEENVEVLDFFSVSKNYQPLASLFHDGLHLSRTGARLLYEKLMPIIERKLEARYGQHLVDLRHVEAIVYK